MQNNYESLLQSIFSEEDYQRLCKAREERSLSKKDASIKEKRKTKRLIKKFCNDWKKM